MKMIYLFILFVAIIFLISGAMAGDFKFQNKSGTDLITIHGDSGNLTIFGNLSADTASFNRLTNIGELVMNGIITSEDMIPVTTNLYTLGNSSNWFAELFSIIVHSENVSTNFLGAGEIEADNISSAKLNGTELFSENVDISQNLSVAGYEIREEGGNLILVLT